jgi:hypothetical protein
MFVTEPSMVRSFTLGGQAQANRDLARRARRLAATLPDPAERARLQRYAEELDHQADRLEREATERRRPVIAPSLAEPSAAN